MADVNIVGKISVDAGASTKSIADLKKEINDSKKAMDNASIGSKEYKQAQESLKKSTGELSDATGKQTTKMGGLKDGLGALVPGLSGAATGAAGLGKQLWLLVANPIGAIVAAIVGVFALLYNVLKSFDPVMDAIEQGFAAVSAVFNTLLDGVLALVTGAKSLGQVFSSLGSDISDAAKEAIEFTKVQQDLDDLIAKSTVNQSKYNRQINELILQSKDRTKTEAERIALIDNALNLEEKAFLERKKIADNELTIAQGAIISGKNLTAEQKRQLKEKGVDYAISLKDTKRVTDEEINALAGALAKQEDILNQSVSLREKALNRRYALEDAAVAKEQALEEKAEAARQKRNEANRIASEKAAAEEKIRFDKRQKELDAFAAEEELKAYIKKEDDRKAKLVEEEKTQQTTLASMKARLALDVKANADSLAIKLQNKADEQAILDARVLAHQQFINAISNVLGALGGLFEKGTLASKAAAIAEIGLGTATGFINGLDIAQKSAKGTGPAAAFAFPIFYATQVAAVLKAVSSAKSALSTVKGGGSLSVSPPSLPGGGGGTTAPLTPRPLQTSTSLDAASIQGVGQASQSGVNRTFVLDSDIKSSQERQARLQRAARI